MHAVLGKHAENIPARRTAYVSAETQIVDTALSVAGMPVLLRKSSCSCGGGCPSCQSGAGNLKVSQPNDAAEVEADAIADRVMRMPARAEAPHPTNHIDPTSGIHRKCDACEEEGETIQRKPLPSSVGVPSQSPEHVRSAINSTGRPLDIKTRNFFE